MRTPLLVVAGVCALIGGTSIGCATMGIPDGSIAVEDTAAGNRRVEIEMVRVAAPRTYDLWADTFAVWIVRDDIALRMGDLEYDARTGVARGSVITHYDDFRVVVTAESADAVEPGRHVVVEQEIAAS